MVGYSFLPLVQRCNLKKTLLVVLGLCLAVFCAAGLMRPSAPVLAPTPTAIDYRHWPELNPRVRPTYGSPPDLSWLDDGLPSEPFARLEMLVKHHPYPAVSQDLNTALASRELFLDLSHRPGLLGQFFLATAGEVRIAGRENGADAPILNLNGEVMMSLSSTPEVLEFMGLIYHETVHYLDWLRSPEADRGFLYAKDPNDWSLSECIQDWDDELHAFQLECEAMVAWGMKVRPVFGVSNEPNTMCDYSLDPRAFKQQIWKKLTGANRGSQLTPPPCERVWAEAAGHPNAKDF